MSWSHVLALVIAFAAGAYVFDAGRVVGLRQCPAYAAAEADRWRQLDRLNYETFRPQP